MRLYSSDGLRGKVPYTCNVNDCVDSFNGLFENTQPGEIFDLDKVQLRGVLRPGGFHLISFLKRPCCSSDFESAFEKVVNDMSADESSCACDKDITIALSMNCSYKLIEIWIPLAYGDLSKVILTVVVDLRRATLASVGISWL